LAKLNRLREAARFWKVASMLAPGDSLRSGASHELERIQAQLKLEQADQERRPVITNHLEQEGLVRPRLFKPDEPSIGGGAIARGAGRQEHHPPLATGERAAERSGHFGGALQ